MSALFQPITLRSLTIPHRVWMSPMCMYSADPDGPELGAPGDWHLQHLGARAAGGTSLVMTEATAVSPEGRISPYDLGLWNDIQTEGFCRIAAFLKTQNAVPAIQIAHAGRKASTERTWVDRGAPIAPGQQYGWTPVGPSPLAFDAGFTTPVELTVDQIHEIVGQFAATAERALNAGFQVAEIHGAHGYLVNEFLSPHTNHRTDAYGGSYENRIRFAVEIVDAVRAVWPEELPLFFRVSATDWLTENPDDERSGWTVEDTVRFADTLLAHGIDLLDASSGGAAPGAKITLEPGYQVPFAERVKRETRLPVGAVGLITEPQQAEKIIADGQADAVFLGRELLRDPYFARRAAHDLGATAHLPPQYHRSV